MIEGIKSNGDDWFNKQILRYVAGELRRNVLQYDMNFGAHKGVLNSVSNLLNYNIEICVYHTSRATGWKRISRATGFLQLCKLGASE